MNPDAATLAAGGPIDLDVSKIQPGQQVAMTWRGRPILERFSIDMNRNNKGVPRGAQIRFELL